MIKFIPYMNLLVGGEKRQMYNPVSSSTRVMVVMGMEYAHITPLHRLNIIRTLIHQALSLTLLLYLVVCIYKI